MRHFPHLQCVHQCWSVTQRVARACSLQVFTVGETSAKNVRATLLMFGAAMICTECNQAPRRWFIGLTTQP